VTALKAIFLTRTSLDSLVDSESEEQEAKDIATRLKHKMIFFIDKLVLINRFKPISIGF
jgi:hypothetical protein